MDDRTQANEVDRLYWETDTSVGEIAERLGLSRRALYDAISPRPAGAACPRCGAELVFANRSRRAAGQAQCPSCGAGPDAALLRAATAEAGSTMRRQAARAEAAASAEAGPRIPREAASAEAAAAMPGAAAASADEDRESRRRQRTLRLGVAAIAGLAVGTAIGLLVSRSR